MYHEDLFVLHHDDDLYTSLNHKVYKREVLVAMTVHVDELGLTILEAGTSQADVVCFYMVAGGLVPEGLPMSRASRYTMDVFSFLFRLRIGLEAI